MHELIQKLKRPFPPDKVHWRIGSTNLKDAKGTDNQLKWGEKPVGQAMCYIDSRDVMKRLDEVCPMEWQNRYSHASNGVFICEIGILIRDELSCEQWMWRSNGAGETQFEAEKGGMSDAFKRAAVMWGIGQYLYKIPPRWINISRKGRDWRLNNTPGMPDWATPEGYDRLVLKKEPYTQAEAVGFLVALEEGNALVFYEWALKENYQDLLKSFNEGSKTKMKRKAADLSFEGRNAMLELGVELGHMLDNDETDGIKETLGDLSKKLYKVVKSNMSSQHQSMLETDYE